MTYRFGEENMLRIALAFALLWPTIGNAAPILSGAPPAFPLVSGWSNSAGNFALDWPPTGSLLASAGDGSYSTASSLFSFRGGNAALLSSEGPHFTVGPADVRIDAIVQETGTISGNLLAGILTARAGVNGFPSVGIAPGEPLLVGHAIDAAAVEDAWNVAFLFALTYTHPALSSLGEYVTFLGPYSGAWHVGVEDGMFVSKPWGRDWGPTGGFTFADFVETHRVPEPATLALLGIALAGLGFARRRKLP